MGRILNKDATDVPIFLLDKIYRKTDILIMSPKNVVQYFGSQVAAAKALGVYQSSVAEWVANGCIPEVRQYQIELATNGQLRADKPALRLERAA
jgi:hypothetical protein